MVVLCRDAKKALMNCNNRLEQILFASLIKAVELEFFCVLQTRKSFEIKFEKIFIRIAAEFVYALKTIDFTNKSSQKIEDIFKINNNNYEAFLTLNIINLLALML